MGWQLYTDGVCGWDSRQYTVGLLITMAPPIVQLSQSKCCECMVNTPHEWGMVAPNHWVNHLGALRVSMNDMDMIQASHCIPPSWKPWGDRIRCEFWWGVMALDITIAFWQCSNKGNKHGALHIFCNGISIRDPSQCASLWRAAWKWWWQDVKAELDIWSLRTKPVSHAVVTPKHGPIGNNKWLLECDKSEQSEQSPHVWV